MKERNLFLHWIIGASVFCGMLLFYLSLPVLQLQATSIVLFIENRQPEVLRMRLNRSATLVEDDTRPISLTGGNETMYTAVAEVRDHNGFGDIIAVEAIFYRSGVTKGSACEENPENCYRASLASGNCSIKAQSAKDGIILCEFPFAYFMNATQGDRSEFEDEEWILEWRMTDYAGDAVIDDSYRNEVASLLQVRFPESVNYGSVHQGNESDLNAGFTLENIGNVPAHIQVWAEDLECERGVIPAENQRIDITPGTFQAMAERATSLALSSQPVRYKEITLYPRTKIEQTMEKLYWSIAIPESGVNGTCIGGGSMTAI